MAVWPSNAIRRSDKSSSGSTESDIYIHTAAAIRETTEKRRQTQKTIMTFLWVLPSPDNAAEWMAQKSFTTQNYDTIENSHAFRWIASKKSVSDPRWHSCNEFCLCTFCGCWWCRAKKSYDQNVPRTCPVNRKVRYSLIMRLALLLVCSFI